MSSAPLNRTVLYDEHRALGARLVDFGGWEMPLHYGSQLEEHHRVRIDAGMFDVSHMLVIDFKGAGVEGFLRKLLANDVARLSLPGKALYSCLLDDAAGVLDDLIVYKFEPDLFRMVVNAGTADKDLSWILQQRDAIDSSIQVQPRRDLAMIAVQGPAAKERFWQARPSTRTLTQSLEPFQAARVDDAGHEMTVARTGYTGEDGYEVMLTAPRGARLWRELLAQAVAPCGLGARDTLRLEAGMNLYGQDMDATVTPYEAGLRWTVDLTMPRAFIGRAALEARAQRHQLLGLLLLDKGVLRSHQAVRTDYGDGMTTSGSFSPTLGRSIALAQLPLRVAPGQLVQVQIRDKWLAAKVVKYPFVRRGKPLIDLTVD
jgi:aminomethyltransferase